MFSTAAQLQTRRLLWLFLFSFLGHRLVLAEVKTLHQQLIWNTFTTQINFQSKFYFSAELHQRYFFKPVLRHSMLLIRPQIAYRLPKGFEAAIGFAWLINEPADPTVEYQVFNQEWRPHQQFGWRKNNRVISPHMFLRIEERFIQNNRQDKLLNTYQFSTRFRYRIGFDVTLFQLLPQKHIVSFRLFDELMCQVGKGFQGADFFDQNRVYAAFLYQPTPHLSFDIGYIYWYQRRITGDVFFDRHIFRVGINTFFSLARKAKPDRYAYPYKWF